MKKTYIYSLVCPLDGKVKYIGKSNNPYLRFSKHKSLSDKNTGDNILKNEWIRSLLSIGESPILNILEEVDITEWKIKEKYYITKYKDLGNEIFNICGGGNGPTFGNSGSFGQGINDRKVKVVCLTKEGEYVKTFDSVTDGRKFIDGKRIHNVLIGKRKTSGGYIWIYEEKYKKMNEDELKHIVDNANTINKDNMGIGGRFCKGGSTWNKGKTGGISEKRKEVHQYSLNGEFIKTWKYSKDAADELGCSADNIKWCASGKGKTAVGYRWSYTKINNDF